MILVKILWILLKGAGLVLILPFIGLWVVIEGSWELIWRELKTLAPQRFTGVYLTLHPLPKGLKIVRMVPGYDVYYAVPQWTAGAYRFWYAIRYGRLNPKWIAYKIGLLNTPEWGLIEWGHFEPRIWKTLRYRRELLRRRKNV
jgi:hypothetical protein